MKRVTVDRTSVKHVTLAELLPVKRVTAFVKRVTAG